MKRFTAVCSIIAFCCSFFFSVATFAHAAPRQDPELPFTKAEIINAYDDVMEAIGKVRPLAAVKEERKDSKYSDIYFYMLAPQVAVMLQFNKDGTKATHVKAIGVDDGTADTKALIVLNNMALLAAVTPTWKGNLRGAIGEELGLTGKFPAEGATSELIAKDGDKRFKLSYANNGQYGLTFTLQVEGSTTLTPSAAPVKQKKPDAKSSQKPVKAQKTKQEAPAYEELAS